MKRHFWYIVTLPLFIASLALTSFKDVKVNKDHPKSYTHTVLRDTLSKSQSFNKKKNLIIASWNIRDLGRTKNANEILEIAKIIKDYDIVAIQEVVAKDPAGAQAVAKIADELNRMGSKWDYRISDPTKSPSAYISERYAFLWKTSKVKLLNRAYLDAELEDFCYREPYIGKFQSKSSTDALPFYLINFHSRKFNDNPENEIIYFKDYSKRLNSDNILILGDFNLSETHKVWTDLYHRGFNAALKDTKTTVKTKCKDSMYLNYSIDNIYYSNGIKSITSGSKDFVGSCNNLEAARTLSDHLPIFLEFKISND
jgi:endonuclease/exonuclease/phosphatase family metal-dependent hydrolase